MPPLLDSHQPLKANDVEDMQDVDDIRGQQLADDVDYILGQQLIEIYSVQIFKSYTLNPSNIYGTIATDVIFTPQYLFNRDSGNCEKISPNGFVKLVGPTRDISAYDSFEIEFNLMADDSPSPDNEVIKETMYWNYFNYQKVYDRVIAEVIKGRYGIAILRYAVFSRAVVANVEVTFTGENSANVYGTIHAFNTMVAAPILLFEENKDNYVDMRPEQNIPLSRYVVIVDGESSLIIKSALFDFDSDNAIVQGEAVFDAECCGEITKSIGGKNGEFAVKVTWED